MQGWRRRTEVSVEVGPRGRQREIVRTYFSGGGGRFPIPYTGASGPRGLLSLPVGWSAMCEAPLCSGEGLDSFRPGKSIPQVCTPGAHAHALYFISHTASFLFYLKCCSGPASGAPSIYWTRCDVPDWFANRAWVVDPCPIDTCQSDTPSMRYGQKHVSMVHA